jgi:tape measure domain-containing protein
MSVYGFSIDVDGNASEVMKKIEDSVASMGGKVSSMTSKVEKGFEGLGHSVDGSLTKIKNSVTGLLGVFAGFEGLKSFLTLGTGMEQTNVAFEVMLGSGEQATTMLKDLKQYADVSPFSTMQVDKGAQDLLNYGVAAGDVLADMKMLGDVAGGSEDKLSRLSYTFSQIQAAGKLTGDNNRELINAGFNPLKEIARTTGKEMSDLQKEMSKGAISAQMVSDAFKSATSEGGKFYGMNDKQAQTLGGKWSTVMANFEDKLITLFDGLKPLFISVVDGITSIMPQVDELMGNIKDVFTSAPVQFFIAHIKDLLSLLLKILPIWVSYKTAMLAVNAVYKLKETQLGKLITSQKGFTTAMADSSLAAGGLKAALIETGIGAFAVGLGLIIEKLQAMNEEFQESIDKTSHLKELRGKDKDMQAEYGDIATIMNAGIDKLNDDQRAQVYDRINAAIKVNDDAVAMKLGPQIDAINKRIDEIPDIKTNAKKLDKATGLWEDVISYTKEEKALRAHKSELLQSQLNYGTANNDLHAWLSVLGNAGVKGKGGYTPAGSGSDHTNALNTAALGGARGGLGEAKVINIKIDTMQKIITSDNKQLRARGQDAVEVMTRALNNIAFSQSQTQ